MEFFGLTQYGASDPIKFVMKPGFKDPEKPLNILEIIETDKSRPFAEMIRLLDIYSGYLDGYSYRSNTRYHHNKRIGNYKKDGPSDMYRVPVCRSMDYGWWLTDPEMEGKTWYKPECFIPMPTSHDTKVLNKALLTNKNAKFH